MAAAEFHDVPAKALPVLAITNSASSQKLNEEAVHGI